MDIDKISFLKEAQIGCFDSLCAIVSKQKRPLVKDLEGCFKSDLFAHADETVQRAAMYLYPVTRIHESEEFLSYMSEAYEGDVQVWSTFDSDIKIEAYESFRLYYCTKTLVHLMMSNAFNPLFFTQFYDGLAVLCIMDQQNLRKEILEKVSKVLLSQGFDSRAFLSMNFWEQQKVCAVLEEAFIREIQCIDSRFPKMPAAT